MKCRLKMLREKRGLNQTGMAMILNVSQQTISRIESGSFRIPIDLAVKAAEYFQVPVDYLLGVTNEVSFTPAISKPLHVARQHEDFLMEYGKLKPEQKRAVGRMIHELFQIQQKYQQEQI